MEFQFPNVRVLFHGEVVVNDITVKVSKLTAAVFINNTCLFTFYPSGLGKEEIKDVLLTIFRSGE